eukprot:TRINITY_DN48934_c0_g1_i1.p1 TRINITY_DN48934_c0_g1~~TRINITY_DN48934_c0_g1_i1.p1  ORF type:complete len:671 (+),score=115.28 TRINITY_DN48934_c0_g1_i1:194-2206(+)
MLKALEQLGGAPASWEDHGRTLVIQGTGGKLRASAQEIYLGNAGTASRFLTTVCLLAMGGATTLTGNARMQERPIGDLVNGLRSAFGAQLEYLGSEGSLPVSVTGAGLRGGKLEIQASTSSQFISSVLLAAPLAQSPVELQLKGHVVSRSYIEMTIQCMRTFGINVETTATGYLVPVGSYTNPDKVEIEGDASSASYALTMAAVTGGTVSVTNVGSDSCQGDAQYFRVLEQMGCTVSQTPTTTTVTRDPSQPLKGVTVDMEPLTDTFLTAAVAAAVAEGNSTFTGIANQRVKECNRLQAMITELAKCGVNVKELPDGIEVEGRPASWLTACCQATHPQIDCYKDHRVAMSFGVLGVAVPSVSITDGQCVDKTYPDFWEVLTQELQVELEPVGITADSSLSDNTVIVIGMRGAGKTSMSRTASDSAKLEWLDMDVVFEGDIGTSIKTLVAVTGWNCFRELEASCLARHINQSAQPKIISCGGGIVESESGRAVLQAAKDRGAHVVWLRRPLDQITEYLSADESRPSIGEISQAYERREPLYQAASTQVFDNDGSKSAELGFAKRVQQLLARSSTESTPESGEREEPNSSTPTDLQPENKSSSSGDHMSSLATLRNELERARAAIGAQPYQSLYFQPGNMPVQPLGGFEYGLPPARLQIPFPHHRRPLARPY